MLRAWENGDCVPLQERNSHREIKSIKEKDRTPLPPCAPPLPTAVLVLHWCSVSQTGQDTQAITSYLNPRRRDEFKHLTQILVRYCLFCFTYERFRQNLGLHSSVKKQGKLFCTLVFSPPIANLQTILFYARIRKKELSER